MKRMKAILVIDEKPNQCIECPCYRQLRDDSFLLEYCNANEKRLTWQEVAEVPKWCPLKPLPSRMKVDYDTISSAEVTDKVVAIGWNACLEEIENGSHISN